MKKPTETFDIFDVVLVPFPFIDSANFKKRPAVVMSSSSFNLIARSCVLIMITTSSHNPWPLDIHIRDVVSAGLHTASIIRMKFFTLDERLILRRLGKLQRDDQNALRESMCALFPICEKSYELIGELNR
jgi:mRNA interferase MazF